jgi:hypothetical protein
MNVEILPANLVSALLNMHVGKSVVLQSSLEVAEGSPPISSEMFGKLYGVTELERHFTVTSIKEDNLLVCDFTAKDVIEIKSSAGSPISIVIGKALPGIPG